ncbi:MAG: hypothetical protein ABIH42_09530, partial [Planctomycetota bacterium]
MHSKIIQELEKDMFSVIEAMEKRGLNVQTEDLEQMIIAIRDSKTTLGEDLKKVLGIDYKINFNSSRDVAELLKSRFDVNSGKTKSGRCSTNRRFLKSLHNPITNEIVQYR